MSAFIFNENMQTLSQRAGQANSHVAETPDGISIKIDFWRWQNWNERGNGEWDNVYLTIGDARELAYAILAAIGKVNSNGETIEETSSHGIASGTRKTSSATSAGTEREGISVPD